MATSNLIEKSLDGLRIQNGSGEPDHSGSTGSIYLNTSVGVYKLAPVYSGSSVSSSWEKLNPLNSVQISSTVSNVAVVTTAITNWVTLSSSTYAWSTSYNNGFSVTNGRITNTGTTGDYFINARLTLDYNANLAEYRMGISKNGGVPVQGLYASGTLWNTAAQYQTINVFGYITLASGDTIEMAYNSPNVAATSTFISGATITLELIK
jgi:hypothetical protein